MLSPGVASGPGSQYGFSPRTVPPEGYSQNQQTQRARSYRPGQPDDDPARHELRPMNYARPSGTGPAPPRLPSILHGDKYQSLSSFTVSADPNARARAGPTPGPPPAPPHDGNTGDSDVPISDESAGYASPLNPIDTYDDRHNSVPVARPPSARSNLRHERNRESLSTSVTAPEVFTPDFQQRGPSDECWYRFLDPVLPYIRNIIPASVACDLLFIFLTDPGSSLFRGASPYILTRIFRKRSVTHPVSPRKTTPALLATILWCVAQTADTLVLQVPGSRAKVVNDLYDLATSLVSERDPDRWRRIHGGLRPEHEVAHPSQRGQATLSALTPANEPAGVIDDVLTFILLSIAVSGGDFKSDCKKWWSKATRLALSLRLNREDEQCSASVSPCANPLCSCRREQNDQSVAGIEAREERRRVFWLLYSLDRHLALSFNSVLSIPDSYCEVYAPLPEAIWENLDTIPVSELPKRVIGPPTVATGTDFLEYFLPLMSILGDIIEVHHRRQHPRLGGIDDTHSVDTIEALLAKYERSLEALDREQMLKSYSPAALPNIMHPSPADGSNQPYQPPMARPAANQTKIQLVKAYSAHIVHVLYVLLHGKWDAICMLDDGDDWITSKRFNECASHAISASQSVSTILTIDPELAFMSYLFGIYLLQGSFILLLFADRMPQLGPNESVEQACENIIRAHEVCVVTLSTEFQVSPRAVSLLLPTMSLTPW
jgi:hypothetical protein